MPPRRSASGVASQSQGPSRTQRRRVEADSDEMVSDEDFDGREEPTQGGSGNGAGSGGGASGTVNGGLSEVEVKRKGAQLAKFALAMEYKRVIIRRDMIVRTIIPSNSRAFNAVFASAQAVLRSKFGMELYELRGKGKGEATRVLDAPDEDGKKKQTQTQTQTQATQGGGKGKGRARLQNIEEEDEDDDEEEEEEATQPGKKQKVAGSKTYILRSTLPADLLEVMSEPNPLPLFQPDEDERDHPSYDDGDGPADSGALINWEKGDGTGTGHVAMIGVRTLILCLVLCAGRVIQDDQLHSLLRRLNLHRETILPFASPDHKEPYITLDKFLDLLDKQNYLEKVKVPSAHAAEGWGVEWRWGNREAEFSEKDAARWIQKVMIDSVEEEEESDEEAPRKDVRKARKRLREDIVKAAGGPLVGDE
ncbi:hypothetical protein EHS25_000156 [Saitozyma podzolica]|uniref:MAGE domain-containing protein n=1 Tax=Saitozyma podzolica TaxID=1890683 RepID=A0A427YVC1_9TREE|nr:hypothetical protein EHS25_000156 [Saitozyma podzolica]